MLQIVGLKEARHLLYLSPHFDGDSDSVGFVQSNPVRTSFYSISKLGIPVLVDDTIVLIRLKWCSTLKSFHGEVYIIWREEAK